MKKQERRRLTAEEKRGHCVSVRLNDAELARLDADRGHYHRGEWLRRAWSRALPPAPPPELNREAWASLARAAANLNQIARALNVGGHPGVREIVDEIRAFRAALIGACLAEDAEDESEG